MGLDDLEFYYNPHPTSNDTGRRSDGTGRLLDEALHFVLGIA